MVTVRRRAVITDGTAVLGYEVRGSTVFGIGGRPQPDDRAADDGRVEFVDLGEQATRLEQAEKVLADGLLIHDNRDGDDHNLSWNHGAEGPTDDEEILELRARQMRNFAATLLLSQGVPMIRAGDEMAHTQRGNNKARRWAAGPAIRPPRSGNSLLAWGSRD